MFDIVGLLKKYPMLMNIFIGICSTLSIGLWFISIITVQSYPMVGDYWTTEFQTYGVGKDLIITPINGTEFGQDLEFYRLYCGDHEMVPIINNDNIIYENWGCNEIGYFKVKVLTEGKHTLKFDYGRDTEFAYNLASLQQTKSYIGVDNLEIGTKVKTCGDWNIEFQHIKSSMNWQVFNISVQNLHNQKRDLNLTQMLEPLTYQISDASFELYEWKGILTNVSYNNYTKELAESSIIFLEAEWLNTTLYNLTVVDPIINITNYSYIQNCSYFNETENICNHTYFYDVNYPYILEEHVLQWKPAKVQSTKQVTAIKIKEKMELMNIPALDSKYKEKDGTYNGTKFFQVRIKTPITNTSSGWGSSGIYSIEVDGCVFYDLINSSWWNNTWARKKPIEINMTENVTDYQHLANITYDSDMLAGFDDIRVTCYDNMLDTETETSYWIENQYNSSYIDLWFNCPANTYNSTQAYVYYKNTSSVLSLSNLTETFWWGDTAETGTYTDSWTLRDIGGGTAGYNANHPKRGTKNLDVNITGGQNQGTWVYRDLSGTIGSSVINATYTYDWYDNNILQESNMMELNNQVRNADASTGLIIRIGNHDGVNATHYTYYDLVGAAWVHTSVSVSTGFHKIEVKVFNGNYTMFIDETYVGTFLYTTTEPTYIYFGGGGSGIVNCKGYYDDIRIRKYIYPEPTYIVGDEEEDIAPTFSLNSTNSTVAGADVEHRLYWEDAIGLSGYYFYFHNGSNISYDIISSDREDGTINILGSSTPYTETELFSDNAETWGDGQHCAGTGWTSCVEGDGKILGSNDAVHTGSLSIEFSDQDADSDYLTKIINGADYDDVRVVWWGAQDNLLSTEYLKLDIDSVTCSSVNGSYPATDNAYVEWNLTVLGVGGTVDSSIEFKWHALAAGVNDEGFLDDLNITGITDALNDVDVNSSYTTYNNIDSTSMDTINNITVKVNVSVYDTTGSTANSNAMPDLWLEIYNGTDWINLGNMSVSGTGNVSLSTQTSSILINWTTKESRDVRIKGRYIDYNDEINYTDVWVLIDYENEYVQDGWIAMTGVGNWSNVTKSVNITEGASIKWYVKANNTGNNINTSDVFSYITTAAGDAVEVIANISRPEIVYSNNDWLINMTLYDEDVGDTLTGYVNFYVNDTFIGFYSQTATNNTNTLIATLGNANFTYGDNLTAETWAGDETTNTSKVNLTDNVSNDLVCETLTVAGTYTMGHNLSHIGSGHCITISANDIIIDGAGYMINYSTELNGHGIYNSAGDNLTIKNLIIIEGNNSGYGAIYNDGMDNITIENVNITTYGPSAFGIRITWSSAGSISSIKDVTVTTNDMDSLYLREPQNLNITSCSFSAPNDEEYNIGSFTGNEYFIENDWTSAKKIYFSDTTSWFQYNNETDGNIWLQNKISVAYKILTRDLFNWDSSYMQWNDTASATMTATYNITGLLASTDYNVTNATTSRTISTDGSGKITFDVNLIIDIETTITVELFDTSFNITLFDDSITQSVEGEVFTNNVEFNITTGHSQKEIVPCVVGSTCQDDTHPIKFINDGDVTINWQIKLNETISCFEVYGSLSSDMSSAFAFTTNYQSINASVEVGEEDSLWIKGNATVCTVDDEIVIKLIYTAT